MLESESSPNLNVSEEAVLTVIIPLRASTSYDMIGRLKNKALDTKLPSSVKFLVIDESSPRADAARIKEECRTLGFEYFRIETGKERFCAATARNVGGIIASTPFILHEDVDLFPYPGFYNDVLNEIEIQKMSTDSAHFITIPAIYLSEEETKNAISGISKKNEIINDLLLGAPSVKTYLPASSAIVISKSYYLSCGGYNEKFDGWGLEDLEYAYRLTSQSSLFPEPADHQSLIEREFSSGTAYLGWRAKFRLHGELLARKGVFIFHAYHPKNPSWVNPALHRRNRALFDACIKSFDTGGQYLHPLPSELDTGGGEKHHIYARKTMGGGLSGIEKRGSSGGAGRRLSEKSNIGNCDTIGGQSRSLDRQNVSLNSPVFDIYRRWIEVEGPEGLRSTFSETNARSIARALYRQEKYEEAAHMFDELFQQQPTQARPLREAAEAYFRAGKRDIAVLRLTSARDLQPQNRAIRRRLREMKKSWLPRVFHKPFKMP